MLYKIPFKKIIARSLIILAAAILLMLVVNVYEVKSSQKYIYKTVDELPQTQVVLILGAGVKPNGQMSDVLKDRAIKALELYETSKVEKILMSGDHGSKDYDEVNVVKNYLLEHDVPGEDIFLDHAGFDTYDSLYRAREIFQVESLTVVTQEFHLARAVYIGNQLGMETYGYIADRQPYLGATRFALREILARSKSFFDVLLNAEPKFSGETIPISGEGTLSWD